MKGLAEEFFDNNEQDTDQKHQHRYLINAVHHPQIKVGFAGGIGLPKEVTEYRPQLKIFF